MARIDEALGEVELPGEEVGLVQLGVDPEYLALDGDGVLAGPGHDFVQQQVGEALQRLPEGVRPAVEVGAHLLVGGEAVTEALGVVPVDPLPEVALVAPGAAPPAVEERTMCSMRWARPWR